LADWVITVHEPYRKELAANRVDPGKVVIVMNGPEETEIERAKELAPIGTARNTFTVAYHGTVTRWYGVDLFIRAIAELDHQIPNLRAVVLGEGDQLEEVERIATSLGLDQRVEFSREYVPHFQALCAVAHANCGVIPNRPSHLNRFALSSKLLEYVALGVPVVVSRLETLAAHFGPDEVTFFDPDDAGALADAIRWVAEHPVEARERATRASERAREYAWNRSRNRLLEVFSSVTRMNSVVAESRPS
jgi:glycosyltransferase involved in cell wall biosynthesis